MLFLSRVIACKLRALTQSDALVKLFVHSDLRHV